MGDACKPDYLSTLSHRLQQDYLAASSHVLVKGNQEPTEDPRFSFLLKDAIYSCAS